MSSFSIRVNEPKSFARAFKLAAATAAGRAKWGGSRVVEQILLRVKGFKAELCATDLCQYLVIDCGLCNIGQLTISGDDGALFLPNDWKVPNEPFTLEYKSTDTGPVVTLKTGVVESSILQQNDPEEWPNFPLANAGVKFTLPAARLAHEFNTLAPMCAEEKGRYALNGMFFEFTGSTPENVGLPDEASAKSGPFTPTVPPISLALVATNGRRLAAHKLPVTLEKAPRYQVILEREHAIKLSHIFKVLGSEEVEVGFSPEVEDIDNKGNVTEVRPKDRYLFFSNHGLFCACAMIEGQFPDYHMVLPKTDAKVQMDREAFSNALLAVKKACDVEEAAVKLTFQAEQLLLEAKSRTKGYAKTTLPLDEVPPQMILGLDPDYLLEALAALRCETVLLEFSSADEGVVLHDGAPDLRYHLVMPIDVESRPAEPKKPVLDEKTEVWDGKAGKYVEIAPEVIAARKAEHEQAEIQYKLDFEAYREQLRLYRLSHRLNERKDDWECEDAQAKGEFAPRPAHEKPIGTKIGVVFSAEKLRQAALSVDPMPAPKKRAAKAMLDPQPGKIPLAGSTGAFESSFTGVSPTRMEPPTPMVEIDRGADLSAEAAVYRDSGADLSAEAVVYRDSGADLSAEARSAEAETPEALGYVKNDKQWEMF